MNLRTIGLLTALLCAGAGCLHISPGTLYESSTEALTPHELQLAAELRRDVAALSADIGPRNAGESLANVLAAERWIIAQLDASGLGSRRDEVDLGGVSVANIEVTFAGTERPDQILVIGAHYDTASRSPGANDNASGVAMLLATARRLRDTPTDRTVRLLFFVNEEDPFSGGIQMGSRVYAKGCRARGDDILAMIGVDSVGCFSSEPDSQDFPMILSWLLPDTGNFVVFGSDRENQDLLDRVVAVFQEQSRFPSLGLAASRERVSRSDHAAFWWEDYPAIFMSDTSEGRDPHYHLPSDVADNLDYAELARLTDGFVATLRVLADAETALP